jgi:hypothetical protein
MYKGKVKIIGNALITGAITAFVVSTSSMFLGGKS